jgi:drug/metabolite transporter (DMT)-like permease
MQFMVENKAEETLKKRKLGLKDVLMLQAVFVIYSLSSVVSRYASQGLDSFESIFTMRFIMLAGLVVLILAVYAVIWQQLIKKYELSVAYANKATSLLWTLMWGAFIFSETITLTKVAGIVVVFVGVIIMNSEGGVS